MIQIAAVFVARIHCDRIRWKQKRNSAENKIASSISRTLMQIGISIQSAELHLQRIPSGYTILCIECELYKQLKLTTNAYAVSSDGENLRQNIQFHLLLEQQFFIIQIESMNKRTLVFFDWKNWNRFGSNVKLTLPNLLKRTKGAAKVQNKLFLLMTKSIKFKSHADKWRKDGEKDELLSLNEKISCKWNKMSYKECFVHRSK